VKRKRPQGSASRNTRAIGTRAERRALWHYRVRGFRILETNAWIAGYELDVVARRGRLVVFCEVKAKSTRELGDPAEMVNEEKQRRVRVAAEAWLAVRPELNGCEVRFDVVALGEDGLVRLADAF
jgi:putative endonuclease